MSTTSGHWPPAVSGHPWVCLSLSLSLSDLCWLKTLQIASLRSNSFSRQSQVILRPTVSQPVCPGVRPPSGTCNQFFFSLAWKFSLGSCGFLLMGCLLWWEDRSIIYSYYWAPQAQSFWGLSPPELITILRCLNFETPTTWKARFLYSFPQEQGNPVISPGIGFVWLMYMLLRNIYSCVYTIYRLGFFHSRIVTIHFSHLISHMLDHFQFKPLIYSMLGFTLSIILNI
jgi:hypothetical protein